MISLLTSLKPGGRRNKKAGLEKRTDVCILVQETCYCEQNVCRHARLGSVQTGELLLLIGLRIVVIQTGRPHNGDARVSRPRTPQGQVNNFGHITVTMTGTAVYRKKYRYYFA